MPLIYQGVMIEGIELTLCEGPVNQSITHVDFMVGSTFGHVW